MQPDMDMVMFLQGRVAVSDGAPVPGNILIERVCNASVRQQVYASPHGDFTMQLGSKADSYLDASGERPTQYSQSGQYQTNPNDPEGGIPRRDLANCELRASVSGFRSSTINLVEINDYGSKVLNVGAIVVQRTTKIEGTLSAIPYKAPKDARKAYEQGLEALRNSKLAAARLHFQKAVDVYPAFTFAWFQLGTVLQQQNQPDAARAAFTHASTIDSKYLPPYLSLASMASEAQNWTEVLKLTGHILALDPLAGATGYILDLDPVNYADAYFYDSLANFELNRIDAAEKSGLKAEHLDLRTHFPQLHLILAEIFARKHNYSTAISELQTFMDLAPTAKNVEQVRERQAELQKLDASAAATEKPN